ncbi:hypothetical protein [uncultured Aliiroseovarius sp.]|uniref:hypothetical protein n=1 Tax=uncultured Aliiroseovarius sp. TaxID=1658783 RepID=UPI0026169EFE|nr:hypothetical protein [uncultured Aliiroseovarius sp.]
MDVKTQVALIGVASALVTILIKDVALHFWKEAHSDKKTAKAVYRSYSDPMLSAAVSLFWRLRETLTDTGRGAYLKTSGFESQFDKYKFESTIYRLAALVGWVRAYRRELTFLSLSGDEELSQLTAALSLLEGALADGAHVETQRVKSASQLWDIPLPEENKDLSRIAVKVEQIIKSVGSTSSGDQDLLINLDEAAQVALCQSIANYLCDEANIDHLPSEVISETRARAVSSLSIREAWLYRDFQSGIGDMMIREISGASRRFEVLGFREFEALLHSDEEETQRWMSRLVRVFDRLDISGADRFDARVQMLERTFLATIDLLVALTEIDKGRSTYTSNSVQEAKKLKADQSWRKVSE